MERRNIKMELTVTQMTEPLKDLITQTQTFHDKTSDRILGSVFTNLLTGDNWFYVVETGKAYKLDKDQMGKIFTAILLSAEPEPDPIAQDDLYIDFMRDKL